MKTQIEKLNEKFFKCPCCDDILSAVYIHSKCHENAPVQVLVVKDKHISVKCAVCGEEITKFNFKQ
ncbi:hypothetical protein [Clostridium sp.]|uniref:hypothetical protein n=1 Tax=Clostridium sp. TaxID=1506 RepID=UPI00283CE2E1|nr:hypothetical protein [Clostridium sp.]MDR3598775.1 hypothetical protein [Clostridium sp.]